MQQRGPICTLPCSALLTSYSTAYFSLARTLSMSALHAASLALGVSTTSQLRSSFVILGAVALNGVKGAVAVVGLP